MDKSRNSRERLRAVWMTSGEFPDLIERQLQEGNRGFDLRVVSSREEALAAVKDGASVLVGEDPGPEILDREELRHLIVPWAGVAPDLRKAMLERTHLTLANSHFNASFVAQHAVAMLLACSNRLLEAHEALRDGDWGEQGNKGSLFSLDLHGKRALLLGYGAIGKEIERRLEGFGMEIYAVRRSPQGEREYGMDDLPRALREAHAIMVSLPLTPETKGLLGREMLATVRDDAILVNVGRGPVIDQWALYEALRDRRLAGAGLDVWWNYPEGERDRRSTLPADAPFWELPNVLLSPHRADVVGEWREAVVADVLLSLEAYARGEVRNRVDPDLGY